LKSIDLYRTTCARYRESLLSEEGRLNQKELNKLE